MSPTLGHCAALVRRHDPDRFLSALFAPRARREALFAVYAFDHEIARTIDRVSEPALGLIRLQWWHETVEGLGTGEVRPHPVAEALAPAVAEGLVKPAPLLAAIEGRERELDARPPVDEQALSDMMRALQAPILAAALAALGAAKEEGMPDWLPAAADALGRARAARRIGADAAARRRWLPDTLMTQTGAREADLFIGRATPEAADAIRRFAAAARAALAACKGLEQRAPRAALPALMPLALADQALRRIGQRPGAVLGRPVDPPRPLKQWRLLRCALSGRLAL